MAVVIKTKNNATGTPASLEVGELAVNTTDGKLFVGSAIGGVISLNDNLLPLNNTWTGLNTFTDGLISTGAGTGSFRAGSISTGLSQQGDYSIAIGDTAGAATQGTLAVAVGYQAGMTTQGQRGVAIGFSAGENTQSDYAVAIGESAGGTSQGDSAVAVGALAGSSNQKFSAVAIGPAAGKTTQGSNAIAVGYRAGDTDQGNNGIIISSIGTVKNDTTAGHIHIASNSASLDYTGAAGWSISNGSVDVAFPSTAGTLALTTDISNLLPLNNTWTGSNEFGNVASAGTLIDNGTVQLRDNSKLGVVYINAYPAVNTTGGVVAIATFGGAGGATQTNLSLNVMNGQTGLAMRVVKTINTVFSITSDGLINTTDGLEVEGDVVIGFPTVTDEKVVVDGDIKIDNGGAGFGILHFGITSDKTKIVGRDNSHATLANTIDFSTDSSVRVRIDGSGILNAYKGFTSEGSQVNSFRAGTRAGATSQKTESIAIGADAGSNTQSTRAIAIGAGAGNQQQGAGSIALGYLAGGGSTSQHANSIVISSAGAAVQSSVAGSITIQSSTSFLYTGGTNVYDWVHSGTMTSFSDERLKKDIEPITNALAKVQSLNGVTFKYIDKNTVNRDTGLIAQNVQAVLPEAIKEVNNEGHLGLAYGNMVGLLVEAIKELTAKVEALEA